MSHPLQFLSPTLPFPYYPSLTRHAKLPFPPGGLDSPDKTPSAWEDVHVQASSSTAYFQRIQFVCRFL